ncbi:MAG: DUF465 domain-containing protein [Pseudomonadales bacterium]|nr:DUF465 domain-containing protein [Pseudomonadales bacterium]
MPDINHSLYADFPHQYDVINQLKLENADFSQLAAKYHKIDHHVRGLQMRNIPVSDQFFSSMKIQRSQLKDQLYTMIQKH